MFRSVEGKVCVCGGGEDEGSLPLEGPEMLGGVAGAALCRTALSQALSTSGRHQHNSPPWGKIKEKPFLVSICTHFLWKIILLYTKFENMRKWYGALIS